MKPRELLGTAQIPGGEELRLFKRDTDFIIALGGNELMSSRQSGSEEALALLTCERLQNAEAPHLLKPPDIVQKARKPCKVGVGGRKREALGDGFTKRGHAVGVCDFQRDLGVAQVIRAHIRGKSAPRGAQKNFCFSLCEI